MLIIGPPIDGREVRMMVWFVVRVPPVADGRHIHLAHLSTVYCVNTRQELVNYVIISILSRIKQSRGFSHRHGLRAGAMANNSCVAAL
jgi:hypothetical protein